MALSRGIDSPEASYQIFYYVKDNITENVPPFMESRLYKDKPGNSPPSSPSLISPSNGDDVATDMNLQVKVDWTDVKDPERDNFSYTLLLSQEIDFSDSVYIEDLICSVQLISKFDHIRTGRYYWKIRAVDQYGAFQESEVGEFNIVNTNPQAMWIGGHVTDILTNLPISDVFVNISGISSSFHTDATGCYLESVAENDIFSVEKAGYDSERWTVTSAPDKKRYNTKYLMLSKDFQLIRSCGDTVTGDILRDCTIDLKDAVLALKILSGHRESLHKEATLDGQKIALKDVIFILGTISER